MAKDRVENCLRKATHFVKEHVVDHGDVVGRPPNDKRHQDDHRDAQ